MNRRRMICVALFAAIVAVRVEAQTTSPAPGRLQVSVGAGWLGGAEFGEQPADLRTASSSAYRLFQSDTHLGGTGLFEARVGFALTKRYAIEGRAAIASPELQTTVSSDAEASGSFTAVEGIDQYIFDGGVLVRLDEWQAFGLTPFAIGGVFIGLFLWQLGTRPLLPLGEPALGVALLPRNCPHSHHRVGLSTPRGSARRGLASPPNRKARERTGSWPQ